MEIFLNILFLLIGFVLLIKGADYFVSGASAVAKKLKIPPIVIGITIVAIGTSLPELAVSIASAISGNVDLSLGNIVGSNIFNMLVVCGSAALIAPVVITKTNKKQDFPVLIGITLLLLIFSADKILNGESNNILSRSEGIVFLLFVICYTAVLVLQTLEQRKKPDFEGIENPILDKKEEKENDKDRKKTKKELKTWQIVLCLIFGAGAVAFGGECVSSTAEFLALKAGMSEALVGLTIVALGTSLPELVTSIVASKKGESDIALGNVIGSNIMNIGLILGLVGTITNVPVSTTVLVDTVILFGATIIFSAISFSKKKLGKVEGIIFLSMYVLYLTFAIVRNYCF